VVLRDCPSDVASPAGQRRAYPRLRLSTAARLCLSQDTQIGIDERPAKRSMHSNRLVEAQANDGAMTPPTTVGVSRAAQALSWLVHFLLVRVLPPLFRTSAWCLDVGGQPCPKAWRNMTLCTLTALVTAAQSSTASHSRDERRFGPIVGSHNVRSWAAVSLQRPLLECDSEEAQCGSAVQSVCPG